MIAFEQSESTEDVTRKCIAASIGLSSAMSFTIVNVCIYILITYMSV